MSSPAQCVRAGQHNCPPHSLCWSWDLPMESASLSNCGNCHIEPKPSSADGSKTHSPGQPTKPKVPPCKSFALAQSFWLGNHPTDRWSFQSTHRATCLANWKYLIIQLGKLASYSSLYWASRHSEAFGVDKTQEEESHPSYQLKNQLIRSVMNQHCQMCED